MEVAPVTLTEADRTVLESYKHFAEGLSRYLGGSCELVLHSLEDFEHAAVKVINGHFTGRSQGAPVTDLALAMLARIQQQPAGCENTVYYSANRRGEPFRSTTIAIHGEAGRIIGLMCINFALNTPLSQILALLGGTGEAAGEQPAETFSDSIDGLVRQAVEEARAAVAENPAVSAGNRNKEIVRLLYRRGVFNYKDSVIRCAGLLGINKNTVYMHLRNLRTE